MGQNIKREIIDNIVVTMSIYISDQDTIAILDSVISSELTKVNLQEICSLRRSGKLTRNSETHISLSFLRLRSVRSRKLHWADMCER